MCENMCETYIQRLHKKYMRYWQMITENSFIDKDDNKIRLYVFKEELGDDVYNLIKQRIEQKAKEYSEQFNNEIVEYMKADFIEKLKKEGKL